MQGLQLRLGLALALFALVSVACGPGTPTISVATEATTATTATTSGGSTAATSPDTSSGSTSPASSTATTASTFVASGECAVIPNSAPLAETDRVSLSRIYEADGFTIDAAYYPHPDYTGRPWSQWGEGVVAANGRFYSAIGDHGGADGNSFIYEYDPATNELVLLTDVLSHVDHTDGAWGYGKVHAQMALGPCGEVFYATYWGSRRGLTYGDGYTGDILFHIDPASRTVVNHGVPQTERGFPTMASAPQHGLIYTIGVEPESNAGTFLAIDAATDEIVFSTPSDLGYRAIGVDGTGAAYFTAVSGELAVYDPVANEIVASHTLPGGFIRAADTLPDGSLVGVTQRPDTFFRVDGNGLTIINDALGYTTSVAYLPSAGEFYYLPGAHGDSAVNGAILKAVDPETGAERDVIALADIVSENLDATLGGTYNVVLDESANRLYIGVNVDPTGTGNGFGEVALLVIGLP